MQRRLRCQKSRPHKQPQQLSGSSLASPRRRRRPEDLNDERVHSFFDRPLEGDWPYLWIDATYVKVQEAGRIVSVAVIIAVAVNTDGDSEVLGMRAGTSEAEQLDGSRRVDLALVCA